MFTWRPIYLEIVQRLQQYQFGNADLVELFVRMHREGLKVSSFLDRDAAGKQFQLEEMDPFTFIASFNRGITDTNRRAILEFLKAEWKLKSALPQDFAGLPLVNMQKSWFMPFKFRREADHVSTLWRFFLHCATVKSSSDLDVALFDECHALRGIGLAYLTMGMFWTNPEIWLSFDKVNIAFARSLEVSLRPTDGTEYLQWLGEVRRKTASPFWEFSHKAFVASREQDEDESSEDGDLLTDDDIASPFNLLFETATDAGRVLDQFGRILAALGAKTAAPPLALTLQEIGESGALMQVIYGRWVVFGYRHDGDSACYQLLVPEQHEIAGHLEEYHTVSNPDADASYVLGFVDEDWFAASEEMFWQSAKTTLAAVVSNFKGWQVTPFADSDFPELFDLVVDPDGRIRLLSEGVEDWPRHQVDYWAFAPGRGAEYWEDAQANAVAAIGWDKVGDLNRFSSREDIISRCEQVYPDRDGTSAGSMLWHFCFNLKPGDVVFAKKGLYKICGWGLVRGDYRYDKSREFHRHLVPVEWQSTVEHALPDNLQLPLPTLTRMSDKTTFLEAVSKLYPNIPGLGAEATTLVPGVTQEYTKQQALTDLFMEEAQLDKILRQLRRKQNVVLQGAPGTGKTFVARRIAYLLMGVADKSRAPMMQFHQSMTYEDFVQGYRPDGAGGFAIRNGAFYDFCEVARKQPDRKFVFIIDEINRGNLSKIFGELLMLLEHDKREGGKEENEDYAVRLAYSQSSSDLFSVPKNIYLIGTMNTADRSLSIVDFALRRRFSFVTLEPGFSSSRFAAKLTSCGATENLIAEIRRRMGAINEKIRESAAALGPGYQIGHSFFVPDRGQLADAAWLNDIIEFEILPLLEEYWFDEPDELENACRIVRGQV